MKSLSLAVAALALIVAGCDLDESTSADSSAVALVDDQESADQAEQDRKAAAKAEAEAKAKKKAAAKKAAKKKAAEEKAAQKKAAAERRKAAEKAAVPKKQPIPYYQNCDELRRDHPNGVASDSEVGRAQKRSLDRDKDGWMCER